MKRKATWRKKVLMSLLCCLLCIAGVSAGTAQAEITLKDADETTWRVLVIAIDPEVDVYGTKTKASEYLGFSLEESVSSLKKHIETGSRGQVNVKIVDTVHVNEFPHYKGYDTITEEQFFNLYPTPDSFRDWVDRNKENLYIPTELDSGFYFDYEYLLKKTDLVNRRNRNEFDMVWVFSIDPSSMWEANIVGQGDVSSNGEMIYAECENFLLLGLTLSRPDGAIESFCHAYEGILNDTFRNTTSTGNPYGGQMKFDNLADLNMWEKFRYCKVAGDSNHGVYGVGMVHYSPNSEADYDWQNTSPVKSYYTDFMYNYPNIGETVTTFTPNSTYLPYTDSAAEAHHEWWLSLMPHFKGRDTQGYSHNWWSYISKCDPTAEISKADAYDGTITLNQGDVLSDLYITASLLSGKKEKIELSDTTCTTENKGKISVNNGKITAVKPGTEKLKVMYDGYSVEYTISVSCDHKNTMDVAAQQGNCNETGYTAGVFCKDCEEYISGHEEVVPGHSFRKLSSDGTIAAVKCSKCGAAMNVLELETQPEAGKTILFGRYEQDGNSKNGAEDIEWEVLEVSGSKMLLLSKNCLDTIPYHEKKEAVSWNNSSLRAWLNNKFMETAFSNAEKGSIMETKVPYTVSGDKTVQDKVFLLSKNELETYKNTDALRVAEATGQAIKNGAWNSVRDCCWWLRAVGEGMQAPLVDFTGAIFVPGNQVTQADDTVRPAMWISYYSCAHENTVAVEGKKATCVSEGYSEGKYCNDCEQFIEGHKVIQKNEEHSWDAGTVIKQSTVEAEGMVEYCCTACSAKKQETIPKAEPEPTVTPEPTEEPEPTAEPTPLPKPTEVPEVTTAPEPTKEPEVTTAPEPTEVPEVTTVPEPTEEPEVTTAPEPTEKPEPTSAPEPTGEPESADTENPSVDTQSDRAGVPVLLWVVAGVLILAGIGIVFWVRRKFSSR